MEHAHVLTINHSLDSRMLGCLRFVLATAVMLSLGKCMIELDGRRGQIRIQLKGGGTADLAELTRKF